MQPQVAGGVKKKEVVMQDDDYDTESYENFGDVEDVESLTDDNKRIKQSTLGSAMQPAHSSQFLKGYKEKMLGD